MQRFGKMEEVLAKETSSIEVSVKSEECGSLKPRVFRGRVHSVNCDGCWPAE